MLPTLMRALLLPLLASLLLASPAHAQRRVILLIGDGVGVSYWTAARIASDRLAVSQFRIIGLVDTRSADSRVTDSAAGATAYATGVRTFNGAIGVGPDSTPVETVLEAARKRGWATGLVATSSVTHATPAAFAAHVASRASQFDIAQQMTAQGIDVLLGGGTRWFSAAVRPDRANLLARLDSSHTVVTTAGALDSVSAVATRGLVGLFAEDHMPAAPERAPSLPAMTRKAIDVLSRDPDGFFLMVEGSQPDWRGHDNGGLEAVTAEMLDFDAAIGVALEYQRRVGDVLVLVVADHETGGLAIETAPGAAPAEEGWSMNAAMRGLARALGMGGAPDTAGRGGSPMPGRPETRPAPGAGMNAERLVADYTTGEHTAAMIPLFASGPGAERFAGIIDNDRVGQLLLEVVRQPPRRRR